MTDEDGSRRWEEVEGLLRRLEPWLTERFRECDIAPTEASSLLEEVVTLLLYRWDEVAKPEAWVMEMVKTRIRRLQQESR